MASERRSLFAGLGRAAIAAGIAAAFILGLAGTVYLSLRTSEVTVPDVLGKHFLQGEQALADAGLDVRRRAKRLKPDAPPDTILDQSPRAGEVVKSGQTVAVVVADENSGKEIKQDAPEGGQQSAPQEEKPPAAGPQSRATNQNGAKNQNANASNRNANRNKNANHNANANSKNQNNRNANNANANGARNANAGNRNANSRPNANANRPNANTRPTSNANGAATNANRRPTP